MNQKLLNLALLAVAGLLVWALLLDRKKEEVAIARATERQPPLTQLAVNDIRSIRLHDSAAKPKPDIALEKTGSGWQIIEPYKIAADLLQVGNITALATVETRGSIDAAKAKRADLELDPPRHLVKLDDKTFGIGALEPLKGTRYVELDPGTASAPNRGQIRLIDNFSETAIDNEFTDLVAKTLQPYDAEIVRLELPGLVVARSPVGPGWTSIPATDEGTSADLQKLIDAWREVRAIATEPPRAGGKAAGSATVTLADGSVIRYRIVDNGDSSRFERQDVPVSYQLLPPDAERLLKVQKPVSASVVEPEPKVSTGESLPARP